MRDGSHHTAHAGQLFTLMKLRLKLEIALHAFGYDLFRLARHYMQQREQHKAGYKEAPHNQPLVAYGNLVVIAYILNDFQSPQHGGSILLAEVGIQLLVYLERINGSELKAPLGQARAQHGLKVGHCGKYIEMMVLSLKNFRHALRIQIRPPHLIPVRGISHRVFIIVNADGLHPQTMQQ